MADRQRGGSERAGQRAPHILIVDDEAVIASTLALILQRFGYSVAVAHNGEQALEMVAARLPDMLISDVIMPGIDGFQLALQLKQNLPACAILLISGQAATTERLALMKEAGHSFEVLAKPVHPTDTLARVKDCLRHDGRRAPRQLTTSTLL